MDRISVIIPVYNSEGSLVELCDRLIKTLDAITDDFEIIMVEDCSQDRSWEVITKLAGENPGIKGIQLFRNFGQHNALLCGIRCCRGDIIVTIDDDLQHPPEEIPKLLDELSKGFDVVYGTPLQEQHGIFRDMASRLTKLVLQAAMKSEAARNVSAFRAFRSPVKNAFVGYHNPFVLIDVLLTWGTTRFSSVEVSHEPRRDGVSNYSFSKLIIHAINMMTGFSTLPLQLSSYIGFFFTLFGIGVLFYVIGRYFIEGGSVPGFPFLASVIAIFSGAQLFALGIIGEYLARMHFRSMGRPSHVVRNTVGLDDTKEDVTQ